MLNNGIHLSDAQYLHWPFKCNSAFLNKWRLGCHNTAEHLQNVCISFAFSHLNHRCAALTLCTLSPSCAAAASLNAKCLPGVCYWRCLSDFLLFFRLLCWKLFPIPHHFVKHIFHRGRGQVTVAVFQNQPVLFQGCSIYFMLFLRITDFGRPAKRHFICMRCFPESRYKWNTLLWKREFGDVTEDKDASFG